MGVVCDLVWLQRFGREQGSRKPKRAGLLKATDEAYFVRRLRARAGTVVAPGPRFLVNASVCMSGGLATVRGAALLPPIAAGACLA